MIENLTKEVITKIISEIKKKDNMLRIQSNVIDPLIHYTFAQLYPYILCTSIIFILIFVLTLAIFFFIIKIKVRI
jgi:hypothetical protein